VPREGSAAKDKSTSAKVVLPSPATTPTGEKPKESPSEKIARRKASRRRKIVRWTKIVALAFALTFAAGMITIAIVIRRIEAGLPSVAELRKGYRPPQVTRILASDGSVLAELFTERRTVIKINDLPPHVKLAVLAAEDANFYEHHGLDYLGIARAIWVNLRHSKTKQGASTITQQVVKNLLLDSERTYLRKIREALLARRIEQELTKDEILELYLNHIYFGSGRYGIEEAARGYFGKHANELSLAEAALLAGLPAAPNAFSPRNDLPAATRRRSYVLGQLLAKSFCTQTQYDAAMVEPVKLAPVVEANDQLAPEVVELVRKTIRDTVGDELARRGGFTVETSIDKGLQLAARTAIRDATHAYDARWKLLGPFPVYPTDPKEIKKKKLPPLEKPFAGVPRFGHGDVYVGVVTGHDDAARTLEVTVGTLRGIVQLEPKDRYDPTDVPPSTWAPIGTRLRVSLLSPPPDAATASGAPSTAASASVVPASDGGVIDVRVPLRLELGPEAALVAIDVRTRRVVSIVGNVEAAAGGLDRALQSKRQPGSTFKPFVYGAAIASKKFTASSLIDATPGDFGGYNPKNFESWTKDEPVRLREALANSINLVAVRVTQMEGPQAVIDFARPLGITSTLKPDLAIALGSYEVTPLELATAYATIASGGVFEEPTIITRLLGPDGKEIPIAGRRPSARAMGEAEAYVLTSLMTSVVDHGTATGAKVLGRPVAGKTGTSNLAKDTWFAGFTTDIVTVVWVGYDDGKPLGYGEFGAKTALPGWISFMKEATKNKPKADFPRPAGVVTVKIDPKTGKLPYEGQTDAIEEIFLQGTDPTEVAPVPVPEDQQGLDGGVPGEKVAQPQNATPEDPWAKQAP
jgi:penicillin-binding protein 1A